MVDSRACCTYVVYVFVIRGLRGDLEHVLRCMHAMGGCKDKAIIRDRSKSRKTVVPGTHALQRRV